MIVVVEQLGGVRVEEPRVALADQFLSRVAGNPAERVVDEFVAAAPAQINLEIPVLDALENGAIALFAQAQLLGRQAAFGAVAADADESCRQAVRIVLQADRVFDVAPAAVAFDDRCLEPPQRLAGLVDLHVGVVGFLDPLGVADHHLETAADQLARREAGHAAVRLVDEDEHALEIDFEIAVLEVIDQVVELVFGLVQPRLDTIRLGQLTRQRNDVGLAVAG